MGFIIFHTNLYHSSKFRSVRHHMVDLLRIHSYMTNTLIRIGKKFRASAVLFKCANVLN